MNPGAFAIYLNANARRVSPEVVTRIEELVPPDDIFFASCPEDADRFAVVILDRGYPTVFTGGGDGTFVGLVNALWRESLRRPNRPALPVIGVLSLGTGNALSLMTSPGNPIQDLKKYVTNPSQDLWTISLVEAEGVLVPFAGVGIDAEILHDYIHVKERFGQGRLKPLFQNVGGYFASFFGATLPRHAREGLLGGGVRIRVENLGPEAWLLGPEGVRQRRYGPGDLLYEGPAVIANCGTIPIYGYGMRLLPWANQDLDFFQVRVSAVSIAWSLVNLHRVWRGDFQAEGLMDFHASHVRVTASRPIPLQLGGDLAGLRDQVEYRIVPRAIRLLRFL